MTSLITRLCLKRTFQLTVGAGHHQFERNRGEKKPVAWAIFKWPLILWDIKIVLASNMRAKGEFALFFCVLLRMKRKPTTNCMYVRRPPSCKPYGFREAPRHLLTHLPSVRVTFILILIFYLLTVTFFSWRIKKQQQQFNNTFVFPRHGRLMGTYSSKVTC